MAVVNVKSDLFPATPLALIAPDPSKARGRVIVATFTVANAGTDSNLSMYKLATVPADALWDEATSFKVDAWGFAAIRIGTKTDNDALVAVLKSAGTYVNPVLVGDAKHGLPIWQALGMAAPPESGLIDIYAHAIADATGAGTLKGKIAYRFR
jgi:hypothetical protein